MEWRWSSREERAALMRLAALLCALAALADHAARCPAPVRGFVVWLLRHAEAVARDWVTGEPATPSMAIDPAGSGPADALRLAIGLRLLACHVEREAWPTIAARRKASGEPQSWRPIPPTVRAILQPVFPLAAFAAHAAHRAPDTS
jgi:hypothetical protein